MLFRSVVADQYLDAAAVCLMIGPISATIGGSVAGLIRLTTGELLGAPLADALVFSLAALGFLVGVGLARGFGREQLGPRERSVLRWRTALSGFRFRNTVEKAPAGREKSRKQPEDQERHAETVAKRLVRGQRTVIPGDKKRRYSEYEQGLPAEQPPEPDEPQGTGYASICDTNLRHPLANAPVGVQ